MKYYVIAGEASGDLHASNLMREMIKKNQKIAFRFWGGDKMAEIAGSPVKHIKDLAFMGFIEVLFNLRTIFRNIKFCKQDILAFQPTALILVDYPGFNLRIAKWAKSNNIKVFYYISPQIWAWKQNRIHLIKKVVDKMIVILPFEKEFYAKFGMNVIYEGHPLIDAIAHYKNENREADIRKKLAIDEKPVIALLPGSRKQEIQKKLPIMLEGSKKFTEYQLIIAGAPSIADSFYTQFTDEYQSVKVIHNASYDILSISTAAIVTSGTATLETALFNVPQVVCYKGAFLSYLIAKQLIKVKFISLVNLILNKEAVKELIQKDCVPEKISTEIEKILPQGVDREKVFNNYSVLHRALENPGVSARVADLLL